MENDLETWQKLHTFYMSQGYQTKDLAAHLKVSTRTIQRWLKGKSQPKKKYLEMIRKYLCETAKSKIQD
ncbi:MAG: helix-turn-helix domain-containing protein [Candidatus Omnitrophica bacterium]|nr:helix-turn-helix domain-containing protein [Candidatus Omnitrophota bacterium]MBU0881235.1 helix-turn-helix domain-containing protein [Candidatus Omnitrophota bacterium]MBU1808128.1 helix-turn-helix domain-containing protein [Candidatus Omnitrophota bacterium]